MSESQLGYDAEKGVGFSGSTDDSLDGQEYYLGAADQKEKSVPSIFQKFNAWMEKMGGETRGIERIPEDERHDDSYWNSASMWLGGNLVIAAFALGSLGITVFGLSFWDSFLVIVFFTILGSLPTAFFSTFGPPSGLRQMVLGRFWFGAYGVRIAAFINCVSCVGWTAVNSMASANTLTQVNLNGNNLPPWAGVLVIVMASWLVALFGYKIVHFYEKWLWIPNFAVMIVIAARLGMSGEFSYGHLSSGSTEAGDILSFGGAIFGFAAGWSPYASDYTSYKPVDTSRLRTFISIMVGECLPIWFSCILGAAVAAPTLTNSHWHEVSGTYSTGGLLRLVLVEDSLHGFGDFCMVVFSLSTIANNIPNLYTFSLSAQGICDWFALVPQYIWTTVCIGVSIAVGIPGVSLFESFLSDFMNIISYWVAFHAGIILSEHLLYRRGLGGYDFSRYDDTKALGWGVTPVLAGFFGVFGTVMGMDQEWFAGPIGKLIGDYGGDIGFELAFAFAFIAHASTRWIENRIVGAKSYNGRSGQLW